MKILIASPRIGLCAALCFTFLFPAAVFAKPSLTLSANQIQALEQMETQSNAQGIHFYSDRSKLHSVSIADMIDGGSEELYADIVNPTHPEAMLGLHTKSVLKDDGTIAYAMEITNADYSVSYSAKKIKVDPAKLEQSKVVLKSTFEEISREAADRIASYGFAQPKSPKSLFAKLSASILPSAEAQAFWPGQSVKQKANAVYYTLRGWAISLSMPLGLIGGGIGIVVYLVRTATLVYAITTGSVADPVHSQLKKRLLGLAISAAALAIGAYNSYESTQGSN